MPLEIERKFLVDPARWTAPGTGTHYRQGYLSTDPERSVRVRLADDVAWLTIKGGRVGMTREEFEYAIPVADASAMLDRLCQPPLIEKTRYRVEVAGLTWEVDVFEGDNAGLLLAEVELADEHQDLVLPDWAGREVTDDPRYYNASLARQPFTSWQE